MKDFTKRGICQAKKGLLFLRDCGAAATAACQKCGRPICPTHTVDLEPGPTCPECVAEEQKNEPLVEPGTKGVSSAVYRSRHRRHYYDNFHYVPFYYGYSHYYSDRDYRTFDETPEVEAASLALAEMDEGVADFDDMDDFMES